MWELRTNNKSPRGMAILAKTYNSMGDAICDVTRAGYTVFLDDNGGFVYPRGTDVEEVRMDKRREGAIATIVRV